MSTLIPQIATRMVRGQVSNKAAGALQLAIGADLESAEVILNADDWGRDRVVTNRTLDCFRAGAISSVSSMVFMDDSERAAELARAVACGYVLHSRSAGRSQESLA